MLLSPCTGIDEDVAEPVVTELLPPVLYRLSISLDSVDLGISRFHCYRNAFYDVSIAVG